jgi:hypothetical protein
MLRVSQHKQLLKTVMQKDINLLLLILQLMLKVMPHRLRVWRLTLRALILERQDMLLMPKVTQQQLLEKLLIQKVVEHMFMAIWLTPKEKKLLRLVAILTPRVGRLRQAAKDLK